jgi:D-lactate dehydrogenase
MMRVLVFDAHSYDRTFLTAANGGRHELVFTEAQLTPSTAAIAVGFEAVCLFVGDRATAEVCEQLHRGGTRLIAQRSTGFNNIDLEATKRVGIAVMRVSRYSPYAVAEFAVGLLLTVNRRIHRAFNRTREFNFRLGGLLGRDIHGMTVGVVGTGKIGTSFAAIMRGFGCTLLAHDREESAECLSLGVRYVGLDELLASSDVVSLHVPLSPETHHLMSAERLARMKLGAYLINTSRGGLIDTDALIALLKRGHLGGVGLDVYEEEEGKFFKDLSDRVMADDALARLMTFGNVVVTGHQAFFTEEAMTTIAETTITNISDFEAGRPNENLIVGATP